MKDIKTLLKDAREALKNKDYEAAMRLSKSVLKQEKTNYMALVFMGLSLQELGPKDQAPKAFQKAIEQNESNPLAWNGLINFYEKTNNNEILPELTEAYISALKIEQSEKKVLEYCKKLSNIHQYGDLKEICETMFNTLKNEQIETNCKIEILEVLADLLLSNIKNLQECLIDLYINVLKHLIENESTRSVKYYSDYLTLLYKRKRIVDLVENAKKMHVFFQNDFVSLSWICKIFNERYVEENVLVDENIEEYSSKILALDNKNAIALFSKSILHLRSNEITEAMKGLVEVTSQRLGLIHAWILLTEVYLKLNLIEDARKSVEKTEQMLKSIDNSNVSIKNKLVLLKIHVLSNLEGSKEQLLALDMYNDIEHEQIKKQCFQYVIKININLHKYSEAKLMISELKKSDENSSNLLTAKLLSKQKLFRQALKVLNENLDDSVDYWMEIGQLHWELEEYDECLVPLLKAAKCDPNNFACFLRLGHYYERQNDSDKARRCFEKSYKLNPYSTEAAISLSKVYLRQKKIDSNLALLQNLTSGPINKSNLWAYLQLGLTYLDQKDYVKAIENLQFVIRLDPKNEHCWESLADAYFSRGAYTSALKCYEEASNLSDNALYPSLQVANIKKILGEHAGALKDFEGILIKNGHYVPALKGYAETCLKEARECYRDQRLGKARDHLQIALDKVVLAIQRRSDLSCLWKLLADCCYLVARLPEKHSCLLVPKFIVEGKKSEGNCVLEKEELYDLATRFYSRAVSLLKDNIPLWHDLAACYLHHALESSEKQEQLFNYALVAAQHCVAQEPLSWQHWNLFGVVAMTKTEPSYGLAQHAFIKAVTVEHNCAVSWTNLGILYLLMDELKLANQAFAQGQRSDPTYVNSWVGQAIIAETMGCGEAMDLFRHSTQLTQQQQGCLGYGEWVCRTLLDAPPNAVIYSIHNMHAVPVACDALTWYTEKNPYDASAWNMLGILRERMGLKRSSCEAFRKAYRLSPSQYRDKARINYGRVLSQLGNHSEAIRMFSEVEEATFNSGSGLALALFKDQKYQESYNVYEQALNWLTDEETHQSELLVGLSAIAYMFQGQEAAKTLLFQSIALKPPSPWALYATLSLALLHNDNKLAGLVLKELDTVKDEKECVKHHVVLLACLYMLKGEHRKAITELSKTVHAHPNEASVWLTLATVLLWAEKKKKKSTAATSKCAQAAMILGQTNMDVTKVLNLVALASVLSGDGKGAIIAAQKAVHTFPEVAEGWAVLGYVLRDKKETYIGDCFVRDLFHMLETWDPSDRLLKWLREQQDVKN